MKKTKQNKNFGECLNFKQKTKQNKIFGEFLN